MLGGYTVVQIFESSALAAKGLQQKLPTEKVQTFVRKLQEDRTYKGHMLVSPWKTSKRQRKQGQHGFCPQSKEHHRSCST